MLFNTGRKLLSVQMELTVHFPYDKVVADAGFRAAVPALAAAAAPARARKRARATAEAAAAAAAVGDWPGTFTPDHFVLAAVALAHALDVHAKGSAAPPFSLTAYPAAATLRADIATIIRAKPGAYTDPSAWNAGVWEVQPDVKARAIAARSSPGDYKVAGRTAADVKIRDERKWMEAAFASERAAAELAAALGGGGGGGGRGGGGSDG